jgi:uncharacterized spore protein YtfJ
MEINFEAFSKNMVEQLKSFAKTETVIGEQFTLGKYTCVPIIRVGFGFGSGGAGGDSPNKGKGTSGGGGGGMGIEPIAFLVADDNEVKILNIGKSNSFESLIDKLPDIADKISNFKGKKAEEKEDKAE